MIKIFEKIIELNSKGIDLVLCTIIGAKGSTPLKEGAKMIVTADTTFGTVGGGLTENNTITVAREMLHTTKSKKKEIELISKEDTSCGGIVEIFFEPVNQNCKLFIFGGGHVAKALVEVCRDIGFNITVIDDRKEIIDEWNIKGCTTVHLGFIEYLNNMQYDNKTFITIMTYEHKQDWDIISNCIKKEWAYLGLMGSKNKIRGMRKKLIEIGINEDLIDKVDMPIGLEINSQSAKEIAVSIAAKIIMEKNNLINDLDK
ncbi:MAG: XdhC/CoxI family protein [bacterium]